MEKSRKIWIIILSIILAFVIVSKINNYRDCLDKKKILSEYIKQKYSDNFAVDTPKREMIVHSVPDGYRYESKFYNIDHPNEKCTVSLRTNMDKKTYYDSGPRDDYVDIQGPELLMEKLTEHMNANAFNEPFRYSNAYFTFSPSSKSKKNTGLSFDLPSDFVKHFKNIDIVLHYNLDFSLCSDDLARERSRMALTALAFARKNGMTLEIYGHCFKPETKVSSVEQMYKILKVKAKKKVYH